jgi:hypothetical protein
VDEEKFIRPEKADLAQDVEERLRGRTSRWHIEDRQAPWCKLSSQSLISRQKQNLAVKAEELPHV